MSAATKGRAPVTVARDAMRLTARDVLTVRRLRDRQVHGGVAECAWSRILDTLEAALLAQEEIEQAACEIADHERAAPRLQDWLSTQG